MRGDIEDLIKFIATKTVAVERALLAYLDDYDEKREMLKKMD